MTQDTITFAQSQQLRCSKGHEWETGSGGNMTGSLTFPEVSDKKLCQRCWWEWLADHLGEVKPV